MAKIRVYQLAKELNMDSKELVEKLKASGLNIKNYMSTLDAETVAKAKDIITGVVSEVIEEKRIRPTVIRRRKMTVPVEPVAPPLKPPEVPVKPEVRVEAAVPEAVEAAEAVEPIPAKVEEAVEKEVAAEVVAEPAAGEKLEAVSPAEPGPVLEPQGKIEEVRPAETATGVPLKERLRKAKRKRQEEPARIIRRAEEGPLARAPLGEKKKEEAAARIPEPVVVEKPAAERKAVAAEGARPGEVKKKKERKPGDKEEVSPRGTLRHRKLEVFERADLYEGRLLRRRKKEAAGKEGPRRLRAAEIAFPKAVKRKIRVPETVVLSDLAKAMGVKASDVIRRLVAQGVMAGINQSIDFETASLMAEEFGFELELEQFEAESILAEPEEREEKLRPRPPVVTIMGHVDHGKTSLLDYIRKSNVIADESGGITQHIGAYYVEKEGGDIVFLDTPGHEAFTAMRARGAKVTDIIVLVVAADDGVMPQTREAINHARAAGIPMIVAINKIDKPEANIDKVRRELAELQLVPEEWGGETIFANLSAKTGTGVDELLDLILLQAEMLELKADPDRDARGTIIEARLDKSRGPVATVLIKKGTLKQGDHFLCGEHFGRVRAMLNHLGQRMVAAGPSMPVEVYGISGVPMAGDEFVVVQDERKAKEIILHRQAQKAKETTKRGIVSLDDLFEKIQEGRIKELNIILKGDVQGSLEALSDSLSKLSTSEVKLKIIHSSTGAITETDVMLASASGAIIIGFNVRPHPRALEIAEKEEVDIRYYDVIYNAIQDVRLAMAGLLEPIRKENLIGRAEVTQIFHIPKVGTVAGCMVTDGRIERNANARLLRDGVVVHDGKIVSLKRYKDDMKEVQAGYECGIALENFQDIKPGDLFEVYQIETIKAEL
ncbi:MAG: translation initiation factor IF-2 [Thermodesulfobacteriota bacterium]